MQVSEKLEVSEKEIVHEGRWLITYKRDFFSGPEKKKGVWEYVGRPHAKDEPIDVDIEKSFGGVDCICTATCPESGQKKMLFIKIFRIPVGKYIIECPAGFADGDETPEVAAARELKEETGYIGTATKVSKTHRIDAWKSTERGKFVMMDVDLSLPENQNPVHDQEDAEDIEAFWLPVDNLLENLEKKAEEENCDIDG